MNVNDFFNAIDIYNRSEPNSFDIINSGKVDNLKCRLHYVSEKREGKGLLTIFHGRIH